jgi:glycosyltransferase involved in cell wall biosynthesis
VKRQVKICRVSQTYPTKYNEGKGLHAYHISNLINVPTLLITKHYDEEYLASENHVTIQKIKYMQFPFPPSKKYFFKYLLAILSYILGQIEFAIKAFKYVYAFRPDIIHLQSPHAFLIGLYSKLIGAKVVTTFHGSDLQRVASNRLFMYLLKHFDGYFFVSSDMQPILERYFPAEKIYFTPSGVNIKFYHDIYNLKEREEILLSVGNIRWQKDYVTLIESFAQIHNYYPEYKLIIIGRVSETQEEVKIQALIKKYHLEDSIELLGYQDKYVVRDYMSRAKLFILSSMTEGMPKVILEAFACRLPVVATDVGECKILVSDSGAIVPKQSPQKMAEKIMAILFDKDQYIDFSKNIDENIKRFSWHENAQRIEKIFKEIV